MSFTHTLISREVPSSCFVTYTQTHTHTHLGLSSLNTMAAPVLSAAPSLCLCSASPHCCPASVSECLRVCAGGGGPGQLQRVRRLQVSRSYAVCVCARPTERISPSLGVHFPLPLAQFCLSLCVHIYRHKQVFFPLTL